MAIAGSRATGLSVTEVPEWEARLFRIHDPLSASFALLRSYRIWGEHVLAMEVSQRLLGWLPGSAPVEYQVALLHAEAGEAAQAFDALQRAHASDPGLTLEMAPFQGILDQLIEADPDRRDVWIAKVDQAAQAGRFEDAAGAASEAMRRLGEDPELLELQRVMGQLAALFGNDTG
jgi:tetratricopeptide (TPR) repeat protein